MAAARNRPSRAERGDQQGRPQDLLHANPAGAGRPYHGPPPTRVTYDQDSGAEELVRRRIAKAEARSRALTKADHKMFDTRIRQEPADHTAVRRYNAGTASRRDRVAGDTGAPRFPARPLGRST
jgi:hypothetical protein